MHALVIGGGIAGPVLGLALQRAGIDATVYEAGDARQEGRGAFLQVAPNGVNALKALGLDPVLEDAGGFATSGIRFLNARGRTIGELDSSDELERHGARSCLVKRGPLHAALREVVVAEGVDLRFGKQLTRYAREAGGLTASFSDGTTASGDVLLGCDGAGSVTRELLLQPGPALRDTRLMNIGGFSQVGIREDRRNVMVFGRRAFFGYTAAPTGEVYWFSNVPTASRAGRRVHPSPEQWLATLRQLHADDPAPIPEILAASAPPVGAWPVHDLPPLPRWHDDRVCLAGDAAHAMSPSAGQGASIALEDAVELAALLRDHDRPAEAFRAYQQRRKARADAVVTQSRRNSDHKIPGPVGGLIRDLLLPTFLRMGVRHAAEINGYRVAWDQQPGSSSAADAAPHVPSTASTNLQEGHLP